MTEDVVCGVEHPDTKAPCERDEGHTGVHVPGMTRALRIRFTIGTPGGISSFFFR